jgi:hypothetical protein
MAASLKGKRTPITTPPYQVPSIDITPDPPIFSLVTTFNSHLIYRKSQKNIFHLKAPNIWVRLERYSSVHAAFSRALSRFGANPPSEGTFSRGFLHVARRHFVHGDDTLRHDHVVGREVICAGWCCCRRHTSIQLWTSFVHKKNYSGLYNVASVVFLCDTFLSYLVRKSWVLLSSRLS